MISYHHHYETDEDYSYDSNGNRTNTGYATDPYNRLTSDGTFRYEYDAEGNRTLRFDDDGDDVLDSGDTDITGYTWDHRNRLASVEHFDTYADYYADSPDKVVEYAYDSMDQLLRRREDTDGNGSVDEVAKYVYDGGRLALEFDSEDELTHRYLCNEAIDQVLADEPAVGDLLWALSDHEGTVRDLIDSDRNIDGHRNFDAFEKEKGTSLISR